MHRETFSTGSCVFKQCAYASHETERWRKAVEVEQAGEIKYSHEALCGYFPCFATSEERTAFKLMQAMYPNVQL